jgi:outer membrane protein assembly factor BamB
VVALTLDTGRRYWLQRFDGAITTGTAIAGNRLFFATEVLNGSAHALDATRGRKLWSRRIGPTRWRALLIDDRVHFATDQGGLYALSARDGAIVWRTQVAGAIVTAPQLLNDAIVIATSTDSIYRVARADGSILRRARLPATASAAAELTNDTLILPLHDGSVVGLNASTLSELFHARLDAVPLAPPRRIGDAVYVLTRNAVVWRLRGGRAERVSELGGAARGSLAAIQDHLVVGLLDGRVIALDSSGTQRWELRMPRSVVAPVVASGAALYVPLINGEVWKLE